MSPTPRGVRAQIRFLSTADGGRQRPADADRYTPHLQMGPILTSVVLFPMRGDMVEAGVQLVPGETYDLYILVPFADHYPDHSIDPARITLMEGARVVAVGVAGASSLGAPPPSVLEALRNRKA